MAKAAAAKKPPTKTEIPANVSAATNLPICLTGGNSSCGLSSCTFFYWCCCD